MLQQELLVRVVEFFNAHEIPYMLTGSYASGLQGEPRSTHDVDFVVEINEDQCVLLMEEFPSPEYYISKDAARNAIQQQSMFNLLAIDEGDKVDFWILKDTDYDQKRFRRRIQQQVFGVHLFLSTPEDTILQKLCWCRHLGGSEKQSTDSLRVYEVNQPEIDHKYMNYWAEKLEVLDLWNSLLDNASKNKHL